MAAADLHNSASNSRLLNGIPRELGFRRTAETDLRERILMAWPHRADLYGSRLLAMQAGYAAVARAIAGFEPVTMIAHPDHATEAHRLLGNHAEVIEFPIDDAYISQAIGGARGEQASS
jgi:agmatine deiminase